MFDENRPRDYSPDKHGRSNLDRVIYFQIPDLYSDCSSKMSQKVYRRGSLKANILNAISNDRSAGEGEGEKPGEITGK